VGADGVHVGQDDMPYETARRLMGPRAIIGLSVESWEDVERARDLDVDYLGVSPIFETPTKRDTKGSWGLEGLARVLRNGLCQEVDGRLDLVLPCHGARHPERSLGGERAARIQLRERLEHVAGGGRVASAVVFGSPSTPSFAK
ncbi:MAG: hypothetical protein HGA75_07615, partial [Thiobacillus sp.]|nr:hypothetical protein [Thiobacillus sp.]